MVSIKIQQKQLMIFGDCNSFVENYISEDYQKKKKLHIWDLVNYVENICC